MVLVLFSNRFHKLNYMHITLSADNIFCIIYLVSLWTVKCLLHQNAVVLSYHWWGTNYLYTAFTQQLALTWKHLKVMPGTNHILSWLKTLPQTITAFLHAPWWHGELINPVLLPSICTTDRLCLKKLTSPFFTKIRRPMEKDKKKRKWQETKMEKEREWQTEKHRSHLENNTKQKTSFVYLK